jgi:hypothetical protein
MFHKKFAASVTATSGRRFIKHRCRRTEKFGFRFNDEITMRNLECGDLSPLSRRRLVAVVFT